ncbi:MAG TPA: cytochrome c3 family protein [Terriglobales bacterium]|nr:cytochrome c3 family protein [Terriglobales bacterium]
MPRRGCRRLVGLIALVAVGVLAFFLLGPFRSRLKSFPVYRFAAGSTVGFVSAATSPIFTSVNPSFLDSVRAFFLVRTNPTQPIAFTHKVHLKNGLQCVACHAGVTKGPDAGLPSVVFCMACHQVVDTSSPQIKKLTAYYNKGQEPPWQPVYWFYPMEHVHFQHAPHIHAGVACATCHGDLSQQTVAVRSKNLTMNFCLTCHKQKGASVDCTTCHY